MTGNPTNSGGAVQAVQADHEWREKWRWPTGVREWFLDRIHGHVGHVAAGESQIGDVRVDMDPERDPDIVADMNNLPIATDTFDTTICDPPWKLNWFNRQKPFFEVVRVTRPGGSILWNTPWKPVSKEVELVEKKDRVDQDWGQVSKLFHFKKVVSRIGEYA